MTLSDAQIAALRNLADKKAGRHIDWINIAQARALTELGLAVRNAEGWVITDEGALALTRHDRGDSSVTEPVPPGYKS